jgi:nephrocystin-3
MVEERNDLMTHTWPELRKLCRERQVELVEVDLRWGIAEAQSTRKETLKLCLDEIRACRPYFIGLLGERYGWVPGDDAFTADLKEEQPWLKDLLGKSVTELEILHGVLNNPEMAGRSFFYFRDPAFAKDRGEDFLPENPESAAKQTALKALIRKTCHAKNIPLRESYPEPRQLAAQVLEDLKAIIETQFPVEEVPDSLTREAQGHEAFGEIRRRTYIGRPDYFETLDRHAASDDPTLVLLGESGRGKSALLANWIVRWREAHPKDFIFQHYIGSTPDSAEHWRVMTRLVAEIKRWSDDPEDLPKSHDDLLRDFPLWLAKARIRAEHVGVRFILALDALNQLEDHEHARTLGWLPSHPFSGPLRLIVSTLPGETQKAVEERGWTSLRIEPLTVDERRRMIAHYLARFSKKLDEHRLERLADADAAANPLYLKILLDELRVTGTHERLDERLNDYLSAPDIAALLRKVLTRYQRDYERDRPGLVSETLGLIWAARRGLSETEILRLLKPDQLAQLPPAIWNPLRAALDEGLIERGGVLNFAHDFLRAAVEAEFVPDEKRREELRLRLADDFEAQPVSARSCDELPWLLQQIGARDRLRACLLDIDRFLEIHDRDREELMRYWVWLGEERMMGKPYISSFKSWSIQTESRTDRLGFLPRVLERILHPTRKDNTRVSYAANTLALFLDAAALYTEAEPLMRQELVGMEQGLGHNHPNVASALNNLAELLRASNRLKEAEPLYRRALAIDEQNFSSDHPKIAIRLNNLALLLQAMNELEEAEILIRRALIIGEKTYGADHPIVASRINNLASLLQDMYRLKEVEELYRHALAIHEASYGNDSPYVATDLNNLAEFLRITQRLDESELLIKRAIPILEKSFGENHPTVGTAINNLALLFHMTKRLNKAEPLYNRALKIHKHSNGVNHPSVANDLSNLAMLLQDFGRLEEAEPMMRQALSIWEEKLVSTHPDIAKALNNLACLLGALDRLEEAEPFMRRRLKIFLRLTRTSGHQHPRLQDAMNDYIAILKDLGYSPNRIRTRLRELAPEFFP